MNFQSSTRMEIEHASRQPLDTDHPARTSGLAWRLAEISRETDRVATSAGSTAPGNGGGPRG